ncbi:hypothetical protein [Pseudohoeflea coraliihabitans]|uniref:Uncharacterized protein n=1 Tax=Pseudohoeflea coraliihabitans TaxID=2860393 RepID=A0ABS6WME6_9HYPH|nr:hypothetical protein [Pseudohoeflea sp. DP4N28-3]MBW3096828.1 hypothetical protein [Pseudohoeflea sp. DP4N28-3]
MKVWHRETLDGAAYTSVSHKAPDGSPAASSFAGHISVEEARYLVAWCRQEDRNKAAGA